MRSRCKKKLSKTDRGVQYLCLRALLCLWRSQKLSIALPHCFLGSQDLMRAHWEKTVGEPRFFQFESRKYEKRALSALPPPSILNSLNDLPDPESCQVAGPTTVPFFALCPQSGPNGVTALCGLQNAAPAAWWCAWCLSTADRRAAATATPPTAAAATAVHNCALHNKPPRPQGSLWSRGDAAAGKGVPGGR